MNKHEIVKNLKENHQNFVAFISDLNESEFMFVAEGKWSSGQQLDHLVRAVAPLKTAFSLPVIAHRVMFGVVSRESINYEDLVKKYQKKLDEGGSASGRFVPKKINYSQSKMLQEKLLGLVEKLCKKVESFSEKELDEFFLPHPILGKLTAREMLYFTIYHCEHHHKNTIKILAER